MGAVLGRRFAFELLQAVSRLEEEIVQRELSKAVEAELLYQQGLPPRATYVFKHDLIRETAYQALLKRTRQQYHQRTAQVLAERFPEMAATQPELVAHHYTEAGLAAPAVEYWQRAGQCASERSANPEAVEHLTKGLELLTTLPETPARAQQELDLQLALGLALSATRGFAAPEVEQTYSPGTGLVQPSWRDASALYHACGAYVGSINRGALPTAQELGEQLLHWPSVRPTRCTAWMPMMCSGTTSSTWANTPPPGRIWSSDRPHRPDSTMAPGTPPGVAPGGDVPGRDSQCALWCLGYPAQAMQRSQEALALAQELAHPYSLAAAQFWAPTCITGAVRPRRSRRRLKPSSTWRRCRGFRSIWHLGHGWRGWALAMQGQGEAGLDQMRQGLATIMATGQMLSQQIYLVLLAEAAGHTGQVEEGLRLLAEALTALEASGRGDLLAEAYRLQGEFLLGQAPPDTAQAEANFQQALAVARHQQAKSWELRAALSLCRLWQRQGKRTAAACAARPCLWLVHRRL